MEKNGELRKQMALQAKCKKLEAKEIYFRNFWKKNREGFKTKEKCS